MPLQIKPDKPLTHLFVPGLVRRQRLQETRHSQYQDQFWRFGTYLSLLAGKVAGHCGLQL
jgi:hypothetical protein